MSDDDQSMQIDQVKQESVTIIESDLDIADRCFADEKKRPDNENDRDNNEVVEKEVAEMKSDDDMQGYDTRSEVASSVASDSDSSADAVSSKSFDTKRQRHLKTFSESTRKTNFSSSSLKRNSDEYIGKLNYLFRNARFFIIKSNNVENITLAKTKGVWATLPQNQIRLTEAFRSCENVILIFSAKESGKFSGFARLATGVDRSISPVPWIVPSELTANLLKGTFRVDWISRKDLPFSFTTSLYNPWNSHKPVKIARDGQEVEPHVGEKLCRLFPEDESVDMPLILRKSKEAAKNITKNASDSGRSLYTTKFRGRMTQRRGSQERNPFPLGIHDALGRVSKNHYKRFLPPNRMMASIESYVKRFGHGFRPPLPVPLPFLPPPLPGNELFSQRFGHVPFPPRTSSPSTSLPRYYDPIPPSFRIFSKNFNPLHSTKNAYDKSAKAFLGKNRQKEFFDKKDRGKRKEGERRGKKSSSHYRDRR